MILSVPPHVDIQSHFSSEEQMVCLLNWFCKVFATNTRTVTSYVQHNIDTDDSHPISGSPH
ncbi:hypothetical protein PHYBLDRAFT_138415 [Phycomyces blakesleeanus NRRL 1555(-)]|uniref:Uncharacterized protein n=1 Tax=Phycomyces blakesleeanus (strain ATCC 8743b / DSM 1359 / FGSC 10004 / NBRC 33097 / NRRL 1555) TaxID=763407 RepID=A0A162V8J0_PHYB8|nr:hypothetical protein PHYBLDRAFT_138415 [Phycomyces blakesleeanus NRRL 1555(-)]OAD80863.1 hypothetical protein PHYBLDRAFT_138415 [Phycomyces blakesleeanus NRRL 1555(-)]|eukprot:XP_018298903.1 hypothetical protein PHYBLDRAFT_138415 [Phycomyces blakesleeanus NRRL 1555(-)]